MWEIFSLGQTPYATMSNTEVLERVVMGYRLPTPASMPAPAAEMMLRCWSVNRPSFESMLKALHFWSHGGDLEEKHELETAITPAVTSRLPSNYTVLKAADRAMLAQAFQSEQSNRAFDSDSRDILGPSGVLGAAQPLSFNSMSLESEI